MFLRSLLIASVLGAVAISWQLLAQAKPGSTALIQAIDSKEFHRADSIIHNEIADFIAKGKLDTLVHYISFAGKISKELKGVDGARRSVLGLIDSLVANNATPSLVVEAYREAADFFSSIGQNQDGYDASAKSLEFALLDPKRDEENVAQCEYNMGIYAHRLGKISLSLHHHRKAMAIREANENTPPESRYLSASAMASLMWYASKYDSTAYLFNVALEALKEMPADDINKYFRPANIQNNLAALYSADGKKTEAMNAMQSSIENFQHFLAGSVEGPKRLSAMEGLFEAIDNLAGLHKEMGAYGKAGPLLLYSYQQKKKSLDASHPGIFISEILLGQYYHAIHENEIALDYLQKGLSKLGEDEGDYLFWAGDAYFTLAKIHEERKEFAKAGEFYAKSESLYEESFQGQYDNIYMDFLRNASLFYAKSGDYGRAIQLANKVYQYLGTVGESRSLQGFNQLLNIAEINFIAKRYREAMSFCTRALSILDDKMKDGSTLLDSLQMDAFRPAAILIQAKSEYEMEPRRDSTFLNRLSMRLNEALDIIEKKKILIEDPASVNILIAEHQELIDFAKKIELELGRLTGKAMHLDKFINLHESALYTRIRSRLDRQQAIQFSGFPESMQHKEQELKKALTSSLQGDKPNSELMNDYMELVAKWEAHLDQVKQEYPAYYKMRYATIFKTLPELQSSLPDSTTIIRFFFVDSSLYALVADNASRELIELSIDGLEGKINTLVSSGGRENELIPVLHDLHEMLWKPIASQTKFKRVIIIPDGILYNLNFDLLTPQRLSSFEGFATGTLLSEYSFSYHFSLFILGENMNRGSIEGNYVAFAPGFSDDVKQEYLSSVKDSVSLDYGYLRLLPQPATNKLAKKIRKNLGGNLFLDLASTRNAFRENAGGNKIIHIGTHAEFNNIIPGQSGLIFAKSSMDGSGRALDSNFLSLPDIYNCNLQSNLTILTACESGRPGYQDGEGMVSLAHAFNYAGSERILMALWRIDEQSSAMITENFIQLLKEGMPTDEALRKAKLQYLQNAEGRMLAPAHWAGLVMMGEPVALSFNPKKDLPYLQVSIATSIGVSALLIAVYYRRSRKKNSE